MLPTKFRFIWPHGFREEDLKKLANQKQELPMVAMFVNGSEQNEQSLERTFYRCFLPSFTSFSWGVSEEKIKMWKVKGRQTTDNGRQVMAKAHLSKVNFQYVVGTIRCINHHINLFYYIHTKPSVIISPNIYVNRCQWTIWYRMALDVSGSPDTESH